MVANGGKQLGHTWVDIISEKISTALKNYIIENWKLTLQVDPKEAQTIFFKRLNENDHDIT